MNSEGPTVGSIVELMSSKIAVRAAALWRALRAGEDGKYCCREGCRDPLTVGSEMDRTLRRSLDMARNGTSRPVTEGDPLSTQISGSVWAELCEISFFGGEEVLSPLLLPLERLAQPQYAQTCMW